MGESVTVMRRLAIAALLLALTGSAAMGTAGQEHGALDGDAVSIELDELIRRRVEMGSGEVGPVIVIAGERVHAAAELPRFYERRGFTPAWVTPDGPSGAADSLLHAIERADREGLEPADYHLRRIRALRADAPRGRPAATAAELRRLADLDLLLTDAFLLYGAHLIGGAVDPVAMHPEWNAARREADLVALLDSALITGKVRAALEGLLPLHPGYFRLRDALSAYRATLAEGGWPELAGRTLRPGMEGPEVELLRRRLRASGDLRGGDPIGGAQVYDERVAAAVRRFQARHALEPDGVVGLETLGLLSVPVEERIRQIELNLERWRWLPRDLGARHVLVNIAGFELDLVEGDSTVLTSRVMVGQRYRKTPVFSDRISYLVLSPSWTIPPNILEVDKLPLIRANPAGYLAEARIRVLAPDGSAVDPGSVDWSKVTGRTSYRFRMDPGPENPLGKVKFMFPNPHHVYLHDTPGRELFDRATRAFSSGCIRVEKSLELAAYLLRDVPGWTRERIEAAVARPVEQTVPLRSPLPVHLLYWTAWVERDGTVQFRPDVYQRDEPLDQALRSPPPIASANQGTTPAPGAGS